MTDQLSTQDWLDQGLKTLAKSGFTALKAEPLAKAMGVSRGSFYWHFASLGRFHAAILKYWREVAAEQVIADLEAEARDDPVLSLLDRRRLDYIEGLLKSAGLAPATARARAQILYWAFVGFALSDEALPRAKQQAVLEELLRIAAK
jgi:AcrR family transcriptional regulator